MKLTEFESIVLKWRLFADTLNQFDGVASKKQVITYLPMQWLMNLHEAGLWINKDRGSN